MAVYLIYSRCKKAALCWLFYMHATSCMNTDGL